jgi:hypothetical protein
LKVEKARESEKKREKARESERKQEKARESERKREKARENDEAKERWTRDSDEMRISRTIRENEESEKSGNESQKQEAKKGIGEGFHFYILLHLIHFFRYELHRFASRACVCLNFSINYCHVVCFFPFLFLHSFLAYLLF